MKSLSESLALYAVTGGVRADGMTLEKQISEAVAGGATFIQLRDKDAATGKIVSEATAIAEICRKAGVPFVIDDNVDAAIACGADGVHVGQSDESLASARRRLGPDKIIGVSVSTLAQAEKAEAGGADYLGVGAVFPTGTKLDAASVTFNTLRAICMSVKIPVVAIGGINAGNVLRLGGSGIAGTAVVSALFSAPDIRKSAEDLSALIKEMLSAPNPPRKAALFDMDGTLIDSMEEWALLGEKYLRKHGCVPHEDLRLKLSCMNMQQSADHFRSEYGITDSEQSVIDEINMMLLNFYANEVPVKPGALKLLGELKKLGYAIAIVTATDRVLVDAALKHTGIDAFAERIVTVSEVGIGKESPDVWFTAAEIFGCGIHECVIFEDALFAIRPAKKAGFRTVAVFDREWTAHQDELRRTADIYLGTLEGFKPAGL